MANLKLTLLVSSLAASLLCAAPAWGDYALVSPDGPLIPGTDNLVYVVVTGNNDGEPSLPTLGAEPGRVSAAAGLVREGVHAYRYKPPMDATGEAEFTIGTPKGGVARVVMSLGAMGPPAFRPPERVEVTGGPGQRAQVLFSAGPEAPPPDLVRVVTSEGEVETVESTGEGIRATVQLEAGRHPRVVLVAGMDLRHPTRQPALGTVLVAGRPRVPVRTEPGAEVWLTVGGRRYGPFEADEQGVAQATASVWPGEETATALILHPTGDEQRTTLNLVRDPQPVLLHVPGVGRRGADQAWAEHLVAVDPSGLPWRGPPPTCIASPGGRMEAGTLSAGRFVIFPGNLSLEPWQELKVTCELPGSTAMETLALRVGEGIPSQLVLRVWPDTLSSDFPVAQIQAILEDVRGERLDPDGMTLQAIHGEVSVEGVRSGVLRGEYRGGAAVSHGQDQVTAAYVLPQGEGPVSTITVRRGRVEPGTVEVNARALDPLGRPIEGVILQLSAGGEPVEAITGARGWASGTAPLVSATGGLHVLEARHGTLVRREPYLPATPPDLPGESEPDLSASVELPITAGRVREVFLQAEPARLERTPGASSTILVRLTDRAGNPVTDQSLQLTASHGAVTGLRLRPDGTYEARYSPPASFRAGSVQVSASGQNGAFAASTEINVVPRPLSKAVGILGGGIGNAGSILSPIGVIVLEQRLPVFQERLLLRAMGASYSDVTTETDVTGEEVLDFNSWMVPLTLAAAVRLERGTRALWMGAGPSFMLWRGNVRFGSTQVRTSLGVAGPGLALFGGHGWRLALGELAVEAQYIQVVTVAGDIGYADPLGGFALLGGYRIVF